MYVCIIVLLYLVFLTNNLMKVLISVSLDVERKPNIIKHSKRTLKQNPITYL